MGPTPISIYLYSMHRANVTMEPLSGFLIKHSEQATPRGSQLKFETKKKKMQGTRLKEVQGSKKCGSMDFEHLIDAAQFCAVGVVPLARPDLILHIIQDKGHNKVLPNGIESSKEYIHALPSRDASPSEMQALSCRPLSGGHKLALLSSRYIILPKGAHSPCI